MASLPYQCTATGPDPLGSSDVLLHT